MTVRQFAESRNITRQAVYKLAEGAGRKLTEFTDKKGNLSEEGISFLESLIPDKAEKPEEQNRSERKPESNTESTHNDSYVEHLKSEVEYLRKELSRAHTLVDQAQQIHFADIRKISELESDLKLLQAGSPDKAIPINAEGEINPSEADSLPGQDEKPDPEGESQEEKDPETDQPEDAEKKTDQEPDKKDSDPEKPEGESSSPVTDQEQSKQEPKTEPQQTETKTKPSLRKRLHYLFHGE